MDIWKCFGKDDDLYCSQLFEWKEGVDLPESQSLLLDNFTSDKDLRRFKDILPFALEILIKGDCFSGLVKDLAPVDRDYLSALGMKAVFAVPVFVKGAMWGVIGFDNCKEEHLFTEQEQSIMRSGGLSIVDALLRNEMAINIRETSEKLKIALEEAQRASSSKSDFLARMSHEMRTPLNAIIGLSELCLENDGLDGDLRLNLEKINDAGLILLRTVNDILDLSKIEAGKLDLVTVDYDTPSLINDTVTQNLLRIGEKPIEFKLVIDEDLFAHLHGDELRVRQIINNLLSNAIKYTERGFVELSILCTREGETVWLDASVRDTGIGIKPEDLENLFRDYMQMDKLINRNTEGTGLGLGITEKLVSMMDGGIAVQSEYGKGSVFTVRLAQGFVNDIRIGAEAIESLLSFRYFDDKRDRKAHLNRIKLPYARVLIVDDNMTNLEVAKGLLKPYGMQIDCVTRGQAAINAMEEERVRYDAVFMDHMMPEMDGVEAVKRIRGLDSEYARTITIIALTANALVGNEEMFLENGFQAFLSKPINTIKLDEIINEWIRNEELEKAYLELSGMQQAHEGGGQGASVSTGSGQGGSANGAGQGGGSRRSCFERRMHDASCVRFDVEKGLDRFDGDEETYLKVIESYVSNTHALLDLVEGVSADALADYAVTVHGIKGASHGIYATAVAQAAEDLEKAAKSGEYAFVEAHNGPFLTETRKLLRDLREMLDEAAEDNPKPTQDLIDREDLIKLADACQSYDMDTVDTVLEVLEGHQYVSDSDLASWLIERIKTMDFEEIEERLLELLSE